MTDPSQMSDEELMAALGRGPAASPQARQSSGAPRGIRNHNAGNLKDGPFARSQPGYIGSSGGFAQFDTPESGNGAQERLLVNSYLAKGHNTPSRIVNRYAPVGPENSPASVANYTGYIAQRLGIGPNDEVGPQQAQQLAQAMREFENGQTQGAPRPPQADFTGLSDDDLLAQLGQAPEEAVPVGSFEGLAPGGEAIPGSSQRAPIDLSGRLMADDVPRLVKGAWVKNGEEVYQLPGDAYQDRARSSDEEVGDQVYIRRPNLQDGLVAAGTAFSEQIPFGDEAIAAGAGLLSGRGYSDVREQQRLDKRLFNQTDRGARVAGGLAGFGAGLAAPGTGLIAGGSTAISRAGRAAAVGGGLGAVYGAGAAEGGIDERLRGAAVGGGLGLVAGGVLQGAGERLGQIAANATPSAARRLSREGVDLTPGQMVSGAPVIGPALRSLEEGASSIPLVGAPIAAARERSLHTFNRAAINRSLSPIGESLPKNTKPGYEAVEAAQTALGRAYDEVLPRVQATLDRPLYDELAGVLNRAATEMPEDLTRQLAAVMQNRVFRGVEDSNGVIDGQMFKRIESELGALSRNYRTASDPASRSFGQAVDDTRTAMRDLIARHNPTEAARIGKINEGYANLVRVEDAAGSTASQALEGVFSPTQLGMAAARGSGRSAKGRGDALMQDLAVAGRAVLPSRVGDSGTATRGAVTGLVAGAGAAVNPGVALPTAAALGLGYSRPVQTALNAIYRATDRPGATAEGLSQLARLARADPALVPVYERALLHSQLFAASPSQERTPRSSGLFGSRSPQMASQ